MNLHCQWAFGVVLTGIAATSWAQEVAHPEWEPSPISTRIGRAIDIPFLRLLPRGTVLNQGERQFDVDMLSANDLRRMPEGGPLRIKEDYELERLSLRSTWGIGKHNDLTLEVPLMSRGGGFMDPMIEWWHEHVLGITNLRSQMPLGRSEVIIPGSGRFGSAAGWGDASVALNHQLNAHLMGSVSVKLPTGDASKLMGSGALDAAAGLYYHTQLAHRWNLDVMGGLVAQGKPTRLEGARGLVHQASLSLSHRWNSRDAWVLQWQSEASALVTGIAGSDSTQRSLSLAYERKLSDKQSIQAYFTEDGDFLNYRVPEVVNIAPDFSIGLNWRMRF